jgi:4-carboxymuconolactone decarboxylase
MPIVTIQVTGEWSKPGNDSVTADQQAVQFSTDVLFGNLWLRPALTPRDRGLVTVSTVVATGQFPQLAGYVNRAMDNGLTQAQASEVMTQLAFYSGWSSVFTALPIVKDVFEKRPN